MLHTYSFAVRRLDLLVPFCDYVTLVQPSGKAGFGRGRHDALAGAAGERPDLAASEASPVNCDTRTRTRSTSTGSVVKSRADFRLVTYIALECPQQLALV